MAGSLQAHIQDWHSTAHTLRQSLERVPLSTRQKRPQAPDTPAHRQAEQHTGRPQPIAGAGTRYHGHRVHLLRLLVSLGPVERIPQTWVSMNMKSTHTCEELHTYSDALYSHRQGKKTSIGLCICICACSFRIRKRPVAFSKKCPKVFFSTVDRKIYFDLYSNKNSKKTRYFLYYPFDGFYLLLLLFF